MSDATSVVTMLDAVFPADPRPNRRQDRLFLTACRANAQAAVCSRPHFARHAPFLLLTAHSFARATYARLRASRPQRQRAL